MKQFYERVFKKELTQPALIRLLLLTAALTFLCIKITNFGLNQFMNQRVSSIYTYEYSIGLLGYLFAIPSFFVSLMIFLVISKFKSRLMASSFEQKIGFFSYMDRIGNRKVVNSLLWMIRFIYKIVSLCLQPFFYLLKVVFARKKLSDSSVHPYYPSSLDWDANDNEKQNIQNRIDAERTAENERLRLKREAEFEARKAQEAADRARKEFEKQATYNANTIHTENRLRDATRKQAEANQAADRLKKMR